MASTISAGTTAGTAIAIAGDTTGNLAFQTNGTTTAMTINTSQQVGIGSGTPSGILHTFKSSTDSIVNFEATTAGYASNLQLIANNSAGGSYNNLTSFVGGTALWRIGGGGVADTITFSTGSGYTERMRITSAGQVYINGTSNFQGAKLEVTGDGSNTALATSQSTTASRTQLSFTNPNGVVGQISTSGSSTSFVTSSDYRLKDNVVLMTNALDTVAQLKPVTYKWKADGTNGQGFIAHELQEVCPEAVSGEKDAIETYTDENGNEQTRIKPQGIDTSFLVATLTAAIQELNAKVDAQAAEIAALKGAQ
jgi:hypothetical protein